jgi:hypothetical protein
MPLGAAIAIRSDLSAACDLDFGFYSLLRRACLAIVGNSDNTFAHFYRPFAYLKHFRQPSGLRVHLLVMGTGSPFLVDPKGKPKDNISVSVNPVGFWLQGELVLHGDPSRSTYLAG